MPGDRARPALAGYTPELVDQLLAVVAAAVIGAHAAYTVTAHDSRLLATVPFVVYGLFRYLLCCTGAASARSPKRSSSRTCHCS